MRFLTIGATRGVAKACALVALLGTGASACKKADVPERHFYDEQIQPIFNSFCVGNTSPCHRVDPVTQTALGNLDLSSFDGVQKRRDALRTYGNYPQPLLLLKAIPEESIFIPYAGTLYTSEIRHAGGKPLVLNTDAYFELKRWLDNGATIDGLPPAPTRNVGQGACNTALPPDAPTVAVDHNSDAYTQFISNVQPLLLASCAFATCHSSPQADFYMTCGSDDAQKDYNFVRAASFVAPMADNVEQSEILLRPLDPHAGGVSHTGGVFFSSRTDPTWLSLKTWALAVQASPPEPSVQSTGEKFFDSNVMPILVRRGCALEGCHSPNGFNDFRLRPGAQGFMSRFAVHRNYETALTEFMALDAVDVRASRVVRKNIFPQSGGITHRGGSLLEGAAGQTSSDPCPSPYDPMASSVFCTLLEWHRLERTDHASDVSPLAMGDTLPLAFVSRPPNADSLLAFDTFRGGADLKLADATVGAAGAITAVANVRSALAPCAGLAGRTDLDVRGPEWSYDGTKLVFAARQGDAGGLDLWLLDVAGKTCRQLSSDNGRLAGAVKVHNLDPVFAPDGSVVFASTRGGTFTLKRLLPATDLYRVGPTLDFSAPEQMTFLTNSELSPAFMQNGQMSFTAEKATPDFYQLSGRRMNWDLTDYHPLLAQRSQSSDTFGMTHPSVGYQQATEIREGLDRNFMFIASDADAKGGGGALATFNRSIGPFEEDRTEVTFLRSMQIVDPNATGRVGTQGVYRSPFALPNGEILASYAGNVADPSADTPRYDLVAVDPTTHARRMLLAGADASLVEAALGYKRAERLLFHNLPQLVFGGHSAMTGDTGEMHFPDLPLLATLLGANLRRGRNVAAFDGGTTLRVWKESPPTSASPDMSKITGSQMVYSDRTPLGQANLEVDHSLRVAVPAHTPLILELVDGSGKSLFTMTEEHQVGPGEVITPGVPRHLFNGVCAGCHGSLSGQETDIAVTADALTGASVSLSRDKSAKPLQ